MGNAHFPALVRSHYAAMLALTASDTAAMLDSLAIQRDKPRRAYEREASAYRNAAIHAESLLDEYAAGWLPDAEYEIAQSRKPATPPGRIPSQRLRHVPLNPNH
jgi:hypothetical protein